METSPIFDPEGYGDWDSIPEPQSVLDVVDESEIAQKHNDIQLLGLDEPDIVESEPDFRGTFERILQLFYYFVMIVGALVGILWKFGIL